MKYWIYLSLITSFISSIWSTATKYSLKYYHLHDMTPKYSIISAVLLIIFYYVKDKDFSLSRWGVLSGILSATSMMFLSKSVDITHNVGLSLALFRSQTLLTTLVENILYKENLSFRTIFAIITIVAGTIIILISTKNKNNSTEEFKIISEEDKDKNDEDQNDENQNDENQHDESKNDENQHDESKNDEDQNDKDQHEDKSDEDKNDESKSYKWIIFGLLSSIAMTRKDIASKKGIYKKGEKDFVKMLLSTSLFEALALFGKLYAMAEGGVRPATAQRRDLSEIDFLQKVKDPTFKEKMIGLILPSLSYAFYQYYLLRATQNSPNVGAVKAVVGSSIVITTFIARFLFKSRINRKELFGIILIILGIFGLSHTK